MTSPGPQNPTGDPPSIGNTAANPYENLADFAAIDRRIAELSHASRRKNSNGDPAKRSTGDTANPCDYENLDVATIDARITELTERLSQRRGGSGHVRGEPLPTRQTGMANIAGAAADSFAQAFGVSI